MDYIMNEKSDIFEKNNLEHFDQKKIKNACHYACSSMNYTNIIV